MFFKTNISFNIDFSVCEVDLWDKQQRTLKRNDIATQQSVSITCQNWVPPFKIKFISNPGRTELQVQRGAPNYCGIKSK